MQPIRIPGLPGNESFSDASLAARVQAEVQAAERDHGAPDAGFRVGAELRFDVAQSNGEYKRYELIGGGKFLRDPVSRTVWHFTMGKEMLADILPRLARLDDLAEADIDAREDGRGPP